MAENEPNTPAPTESESTAQVNWGAVMLAAAVLVLATALVNNVVMRTLMALVAFMWAFSLMRPTAPETDVQTPMLDKLRSEGQGLDRRKYGRLRAYTDRILEHVRAMNRLAVDARQGKVTRRHAIAEMDRLTEMMRGVVQEIRKAAGIPTPAASLSTSTSEKKPQPQVIMPKQRAEKEREAKKEAAATGANEGAGADEDDDLDLKLRTFSTRADSAGESKKKKEKKRKKKKKKKKKEQPKSVEVQEKESAEEEAEEVVEEEVVEEAEEAESKIEGQEEEKEGEAEEGVEEEVEVEVEVEEEAEESNKKTTRLSGGGIDGDGDEEKE